MKKIILELDCEETKCGKCNLWNQGEYPGGEDPFCLPFAIFLKDANDRGVHYDPLRAPACIKAEIK